MLGPQNLSHRVTSAIAPLKILGECEPPSEKEEAHFCARQQETVHGREMLTSGEGEQIFFPISGHYSRRRRML